MNVYFHPFGCKANQYDSDVVRRASTDRGAVVVDDPARADLAVINSCTVTHESDVKLRRLVRHVSRAGPAETIVMGCAAALDDGAIAALPSVRAVVGGADVGTVLNAAGLSTAIVGARHAVPLHAPVRHGTRFRGLLKIQDGCDEHCTFCATTIARGENRSRSVEELVAEAKALAEPRRFPGSSKLSSHVFPFSVRPDAPAAKLEGPVAPEVVRARARELRALGEEKAAAYRARRMGQKGDGVVSGRAGGRVEVLTEDYLTVYVPTEDWTGDPRFEVVID